MTEGIQRTILLESNGFAVEVSLVETYHIMENTSDICVGIRAKSAYIRGVQYLSGFVKLDGKLLVEMDATLSTHHLPIGAYNTWYSVVRSQAGYADSPWTMAGFAHNTDGSGEVTLELDLRGYGEDNYLSFRVATVKTIPLTHIPRASTVGASDANIGAVSTVSVVRRSEDYTHSVAYKFGALEGFLRADGAHSDTEIRMTQSSIPFLLPERFYEQMPDSPTKRCILTVRTYLGDQQIGDAQQAEFTVTAAETMCVPQVIGKVQDTNAQTIALTGNPDILVRYVSNALCTITATAKKGAEIVVKTIGGVEVSENSLTLEGVQTGMVTFACTDSRGYSASAVVESPFVPYIPVSVELTAGRTDPTSGNAELTVRGNFFNGSFGASDNVVTVTYTVNSGEPVAMDVTSDGNTFQAQTILTGLDYKKSHTIAVTVADQLQSMGKSVTVGKGIPVFHWGEEDFQFQVPVSLGGNCLADLGAPVADSDAVSLGTLNAALSSKAPAGYGLGTEAAAIDSLDNAAAFGLTTSSVGTPDGSQWNCLTIPYNRDNATQIAWRSVMPDGNILEARRQKHNRVWGQWRMGSGAEIVKLWENPNPSARFSEQTVPLDLSGYDGVLIYFSLSESYNDYLLSVRCPIGKKAPAGFTWADDGVAYHRTAATGEQGITFYAGYRYGGVDNGACIPYEIYGIKGVGV